ncbi:MAG: enoyl-CoA hydratase/isomerase family protein [Deltaproteobacteria bacterium]|jgi:enoyl-CoA hydratase|nr:enoyl-CoA hydratase/isomerase family protein [Deltaproteobacteria bacterium]MCW8893521.1 enoyl-CoA hydratase/isomerase family protein [Deltaproteobacteria bacterium]MCW9049206.1 enoyl-CoA hydratase/isomerase family protein [Deltaproteobacteria bacterium]
MGPWQLLKTDIRRGVGTIYLDNDQRFNTLHRDCILELRDALKVLEDDTDVGCIVLTGDPGESFAVGANIAEMKDFQPLDGWKFSQLGQGLFDQIEQAKKPVIAALNGITMGGGCDLALACDIRLASDRLKIAHPGAKLGIITGFCGTQKLPRIVGRNKAKEIFMTAGTYSAQEALRMKLIEQVYPAAQFMDSVRVYAEQIAAQPRQALQLAKKLLNAAENVCLNNGQVMELGAFASLFPRAGTMERIDDFFAAHSRIDSPE